MFTFYIQYNISIILYSLHFIIILAIFYVVNFYSEVFNQKAKCRCLTLLVMAAVAASQGHVARAPSSVLYNLLQLLDLII